MIRSWMIGTYSVAASIASIYFLWMAKLGSAAILMQAAVISVWLWIMLRNRKQQKFLKKEIEMWEFLEEKGAIALQPGESVTMSGVADNLENGEGMVVLNTVKL